MAVKAVVVDKRTMKELTRSWGTAEAEIAYKI